MIFNWILCVFFELILIREKCIFFVLLWEVEVEIVGRDLFLCLYFGDLKDSGISVVFWCILYICIMWYVGVRIIFFLLVRMIVCSMFMVCVRLVILIWLVWLLKMFSVVFVIIVLCMVFCWYRKLGLVFGFGLYYLFYLFINKVIFWFGLCLFMIVVCFWMSFFIISVCFIMVKYWLLENLVEGFLLF